MACSEVVTRLRCRRAEAWDIRCRGSGVAVAPWRSRRDALTEAVGTAGEAEVDALPKPSGTRWRRLSASAGEAVGDSLAEAEATCWGGRWARAKPMRRVAGPLAPRWPKRWDVLAEAVGAAGRSRCDVLAEASETHGEAVGIHWPSASGFTAEADGDGWRRPRRIAGVLK
jgi:hypothetical protein